MTDEKNGAAPDDDQAKKAESHRKQVDMMINNFIWPVICAGMNGTMQALMQQGIPPFIILERYAAFTGRMVGISSSVGDIGPVLQLRGACKKAFDAEMRSIKIETPPMPAKASAFPPAPGLN